MNNENLKPQNTRTKSEQREIAKKGAIASVISRQQKKELKDALLTLLEMDIIVDGEKMSGSKAIALKLFQRAMQGNCRAFELIRDTIGQKPVEKIIVSEINPEVIEEVETMVLNS